MIEMSGRELAKEIRNYVSTNIADNKLSLTLAVILIGNNPASEKYVDFKKRACEEVGIGFQLWRFKDTDSQTSILKLINKLNNDSLVTGIIVQLPIPEKFDRDELLEAIDPAKDVDGLNSVNLGRLTKGLDGLYPATSEGVINLLRYYQIDLMGKRVAVIGQSNLVGKPLAQMLLNAQATVMLANSQTVDLGKLTKAADIIISAVGRANLITADMVKKGAVVVDVGTSMDKGKFVGDVDHESVATKASYLTPSIGGVGPMTIAMLLSNVLKAGTRDYGVKR